VFIRLNDMGQLPMTDQQKSEKLDATAEMLEKQAAAVGGPAAAGILASAAQMRQTAINLRAPKSLSLLAKVAIAGAALGALMVVGGAISTMAKKVKK